MFKNLAIIALTGASAIKRHHHHHKAPLGVTLLQDDPRCSSQGCFDNEKHFSDEGADPFNLGYVVPNFGPHDVDIGSSLANMKATEKSFDNQNWLPDEPAEIKRDYKVPSFGMDREVSDSIADIKVAE